MEITRLKRILARIGIGSPLNMLTYSAKEIENMKAKREIFTAKNMPDRHKGRATGSRNKTFEERLKNERKGIALTNGKVVLRMRFETEEDAIKFRDWNYGNRGKSAWKVITI